MRAVGTGPTDTVDCPVCAARAGERCIDGIQGWWREQPHSLRLFNSPLVRARRRTWPPCPSCGRPAATTTDGLIYAHRTRPDDPSAPHCPASRTEDPRT